MNRTKDENERDRKLESRRDVCEVVLRASAEVVLRRLPRSQPRDRGNSEFVATVWS